MNRIRGFNRKIRSRPHPGNVGKVGYSCQPDVYRFPRNTFYIWFGGIGRRPADYLTAVTCFLAFD